MIIVLFHWVYLANNNVKFMDFLIISYFIYLKRFEYKGLDAALYILTFPISFIIIYSISLFSALLVPIDISVPILCIIFLFILFAVNRILTKYFLTVKYYQHVSNKKFIILHYLFGIVFFFTSMFLGFVSLKYLIVPSFH